MSRGRTIYVRCYRRWTSNGSHDGRWSTRVGAMPSDTALADACRALTEGATVAVFSVDHAVSSDEAVGCVVEWLAKGRPRDMTVRQVEA